MALRKSTQAANRMSAPSALEASCPVAVLGEHTTVAAQFAAADVVEMIPWPAGTIPIALVAHIPDLDSNGSPSLTLDVGVLSGQWLANKNDDLTTDRTCGTEFGNNLTTGQAGGTLVVTPDLLLGLAPANYDRSIGIKVEAAAATLVTGAKIRMAGTFVPAPVGIAFV